MVILQPKVALLSSALSITAVTTALSPPQIWAAQSSESSKAIIEEVWQVINSQYFDPNFNGTNWTAIRSQYLNRTYASKEDAYEAIQEMLGKLEDPYTRFLDPKQFESMQIDTSGELTGVGVQITQDEKTKDITVIAPIEGSPAAQAGLLNKDVIVQVDDTNTRGMDLNDAVSLIRGPVNSNVTLTVQRGQEQLSFKIKRARIEIHPVRFSIQTSPTGAVGYIRLNQFSNNATAEMREAIQELEKQRVTGFVLDLRSNPGGLLYSSAEIARMWMGEGTIVATVDRKGGEDKLTSDKNTLTDRPLVILVDGGSASASEILAGALQDHQRAVLLGTQTFGKGLVQSVMPLEDDSALAVTVSKYMTPNGRDINKKGIKPDIEVKLTDKQRGDLFQNPSKLGTASDPQYAKAVAELNKQVEKQCWENVTVATQYLYAYLKSLVVN